MQAVLPALRQNRSLERDALGVVTIALMKGGQLTNGAVHLLGTFAHFGVTAPCEINLHRRRCLGGEVVLVVRAEDGLRPKNDDVRIPGHLAGSTQNVSQLQPVHQAASCSRDQWSEKDRSTCALVSPDRTPAKGEFCRSSLAEGTRLVNVSMTASTPESMM